MKSLILFISLFVATQTKIPSTFTKCNRKDQNFKKCLIEAAQNALPQLTKPFKEINLPSLEPFEVPSVTFKAGGTANFEQNLKNCKVRGLSKAKLDKFGKIMIVDANIDKASVECQYELNGKLLVLPVQGQGDSTYSLENFKLAATANYTESTRKGKTYIKLDHIDIESQVRKVDLNFTNLFNGNKELSDNVNQVLNENSMVIYEEIKPQFHELLRQIFGFAVDRVFSALSQEELYD